jgi:hypothetical protein
MSKSQLELLNTYFSYFRKSYLKQKIYDIINGSQRNQRNV